MFLSPGAAVCGTAGQHPLPTAHSQAQLHTIFKEQQQTSSILEQRGVITSTGGETDARVRVSNLPLTQHMLILLSPTTSLRGR